MSQTTPPPTLTQMAKYQALWDAMRERDIPRIQVDFSGGGDSGTIDSVHPASPDCDWSDAAARTAHEAESDARQARFTAHRFQFAPTLAPLSFKELIHDLAQTIFDVDNFPDWYNGDGGNGEMSFIAAPTPGEEADWEGPYVEVTVNVAVVTYDSTCYTFNQRGEEIEVETPDDDPAARHQREQEALTGRE